MSIADTLTLRAPRSSISIDLDMAFFPINFLKAA
jgi:hypothetical protein